MESLKKEIAQDRKNGNLIEKLVATQLKEQEHKLSLNRIILPPSFLPSQDEDKAQHSIKELKKWVKESLDEASSEGTVLISQAFEVLQIRIENFVKVGLPSIRQLKKDMAEGWSWTGAMMRLTAADLIAIFELGTEKGLNDPKYFFRFVKKKMAEWFRLYVDRIT